MRPLVWLVSLAFFSCRAPLDRTVLESPRAGPGFPARAEDEHLWVEASFVRNHEDLFGLDLTAYGCLPVALRIGRRPGSPLARLEAQGFAPRLYLEDGTELDWVRPEESGLRSPRVLDRMRALELSLSPLPEWAQASERFLFFRIRRPVRVRGPYALSRGGGVWRELELAHSLLVFHAADDAGERSVQVGVRLVSWPGGRVPSP